ncbi:hypothetical protein DMUE_1945 [Dictyocoela muelleri]|nr:hypothetical protein DMUE_1945 [Dictyocoela muelleri]
MFIFIATLFCKAVEDGRIRDIVMKSGEFEMTISIKEEIESFDLIKDSFFVNAKVIPLGFDVIVDAEEKDIKFNVIGRNIIITYENEKFGFKIRSEIKINVLGGELKTVITNGFGVGKKQTEVQIRMKTK